MKYDFNYTKKELKKLMKNRKSDEFKAYRKHQNDEAKKIAKKREKKYARDLKKRIKEQKAKIYDMGGNKVAVFKDGDHELLKAGNGPSDWRHVCWQVVRFEQGHHHYELWANRKRSCA